MALAYFLQAEPSVTLRPCQGAESSICHVHQAPIVGLPSEVLLDTIDEVSEHEVRPTSDVSDSVGSQFMSYHSAAMFWLVIHLALHSYLHSHCF